MEGRSGGGSGSGGARGHQRRFLPLPPLGAAVLEPDLKGRVLSVNVFESQNRVEFALNVRHRRKLRFVRISHTDRGY